MTDDHAVEALWQKRDCPNCIEQAEGSDLNPDGCPVCHGQGFLLERRDLVPRAELDAYKVKVKAALVSAAPPSCPEIDDPFGRMIRGALELAATTLNIDLDGGEGEAIDDSEVDRCNAYVEANVNAPWPCGWDSKRESHRQHHERLRAEALQNALDTLERDDAHMTPHFEEALALVVMSAARGDLVPRADVERAIRAGYKLALADPEDYWDWTEGVEAGCERVAQVLGLRYLMQSPFAEVDDG